MAVKFEIVWNTTHGQPLIHRGLLTAANAGIPQHVCSVPADGERGWRNCDVNLRDWWRSHRAEVAAPWVLFLEWDVAATADLTAMIRTPKRGTGLVCAQLHSAVAHRRTWPPFGEIPRLPRVLREIAVGCVPNAVLLVSREAMDAACKRYVEEAERFASANHFDISAPGTAYQQARAAIAKARGEEAGR